jgi:hypothetical protein
MPKPPRSKTPGHSWADAFVRDPAAFDRRRQLRRHDDAAGPAGHTATAAALLAAGFFGGVAIGAAAWEGVLAGNRRGLFSANPVRRYAAVSYLGARPSVDTARLLRDYVRWESHPVLRRRARRVLRELEATLQAGR